MEDRLQRLVDFLSDVEDMTPEEVDAALRQEGLDSEEVGKRMAAVAAKAFGKARAKRLSERQRITELEAELKQLQDAARELAEQDCAQCPGYSYDPEDCWPEQRCPVGWLRKLLPCEKVTNDDA